MRTAKSRKWTARWISYPNVNLASPTRVSLPAPLFRKDFETEADIEDGVLYACGLGYFVCFLDGRRISANVLQPAPTQYDRRWRYRKFHLGRIKAGKHVLCLLVGNGNYHHVADDDWGFRYASWQDYPKMICELTDGEDGGIVVKSDTSWCVCSSPIVYNTLRGGEVYDARRRDLPLAGEAPQARRVDFSEWWPGECDKMEQVWEYAGLKASPGGIGEEEIFPPTRIVATYPMAPLPGHEHIWKAPVNISGVVRIAVSGEEGAEVELLHGELLTPDGEALYMKDLDRTIHDGTFQKDKYILKGGATETWHPEFTYHGFRYVQVKTTGNVKIIGMEALQIHTDFSKCGQITVAPALLKTMEDAALRACLSNYVGIPTDCPSREKNGWTGENRLMLETLLFEYDVKDAHAAYMDMIIDAQRPSGQVSAVAPNAGFGYNIGSGPTHDISLIKIPFILYQFTGDAEYLERYYPAMLKYVDFAQGLVDDEGRYCHGLTDWLPPQDEIVEIPFCFIQTAFYAETLRTVLEIAGILGDEQPELVRRYNEERRRFLKLYYLGNGRFRGKRSTVHALALNFRLVPDEDRAECARILNDYLLERDARIDYGTSGSASVIRALFENGYADTAYRVMTQPEFPGYAYWFEKLHLTTFPECWEGNVHSLNHGAFTDIIACMYRYLAGFRPAGADMKNNTLEIKPVIPAELNEFGAEYNGYSVHWQRHDDGIAMEIIVPKGKAARYDGKILTAGKYSFVIAHRLASVSDPRHKARAQNSL